MALRLGKGNVNALARSLTAKQFIDWEFFEQLEPFGDLRADYHAAQIATMIANVNRGKDQKPYKIEDFLIKFEEKKKQSPKEQLAIAYSIARMQAALMRARGEKVG